MTLSLFLSLGLLFSCVYLHYRALVSLNYWLPRLEAVSSTRKVLVAMLGATVSHGLQIAWFAAAYYLLRDQFALGVLSGNFQDRFSNFLYFSAETYTSLGFGDIVPGGGLRIVAGIEALTGLMTISWSASFTYLEMSRYWKSPDGNGHGGPDPLRS